MKPQTQAIRIAPVTGVIAALLLILQGPMIAQEASKKPALSPQEKQGEMRFFQRCSICHLPPLVGPTQGARLPFGPLLYGYTDKASNEVRVRQVIRDGGVQMPGFQYSLTPAEIEAIVAYLKSPVMKAPPDWFSKAQARGIDSGRDRDGAVD